MNRSRTERINYAMKAYNYVLDEFLDDKTGHIGSALGNDGYKDDIRKVVKLMDSDLDQLMHPETGGPDQKLVHLNRGSRSLLRCLRAFYVCRRNEGVDIDSTWCNIAGEEFDEFHYNTWDPNTTYRLIEATPTPHVIDAPIPIKRDFRLLVGEIIGCRDKLIPSPHEILNYQHNGMLHSRCEKKFLYESTAEHTCKYLLRVLKAVVERHYTSINDEWSDVKLSDFNKFLIDRGYAPLKGVVVDLILEGSPMNQIEEASIKIQKAFKEFLTRQRRRSIVHASIAIQRFARRYTLRDSKRQITELALGVHDQTVDKQYSEMSKDEEKITGGPCTDTKTSLGGPCENTKKTITQQAATPLLNYTKNEFLSPTPCEFDMGRDNEPPDILDSHNNSDNQSFREMSAPGGYITIDDCRLSSGIRFVTASSDHVNEYELSNNEGDDGYDNKNITTSPDIDDDNSTVSKASIMSATMNPTMVPIPASPETSLKIYFDQFEDELDRVVDSAMFSRDYSASGYDALSSSQTGILEIPVNDNLIPPAPTSIIQCLPGEIVLPNSGDIPDTAEVVKAIQTLPPLPISPEPPPE